MLNHCPTHPSADVLKLKHGKILSYVPDRMLIQPIEGIIQVFKAYYHSELLREVVNSELQITKFLNTSTIKDVYSIGLAWGKVMATTAENCWEKCHHRRQARVNSISNTRRESCM
jgi:hypothetical protein